MGARLDFDLYLPSLVTPPIRPVIFVTMYPLFDAVFQSQDLLEQLWSISARSQRVSNWAERRADAMKVFTAGVAFDINTLLNDILRRAPAADIGSDLCFKVCDDAEGSDNLISVQDSWAESSEQAATYGSRLLQGSGRWYSMVVCYHSKKRALRFCFFTVQGMFVTPALRLSVQSEFGQLVDALFAFCDLTSYERGFHPLFIDHPQKYVLLPLDARGSTAWWKVARILSVRTAFRDHKSMVAVIHQADIGKAIREEEVSIPWKPLGNYEGSLLDERRRWLDKVLAKAECLPLGLDGFPAQWKLFVQLAGPLMNFKEAVLKMSYYLQEDSDVQKEIFRSTAGQHGIPDVLPILELNHGLGIFRGLTSISCPDISSATSGQHDVEIEDRVEMISIFLDNGQSLLGPDLTIRSWIKCLMDGILGCFHLFLAGYLHRDISIGNVLRRREPQNRVKLRNNNHPHLQTDCFAFMNNVLDSCSGFLIDSDTAIKWRSSKYAQSAHRRFYGTRQFVSRRLLFMWEYSKDPVVHTIFDDLESFAWLALWIAASRYPDSPHSQRFLDCLDRDFETLLVDKTMVAVYITDELKWRLADRGKPESAIRTIRPLLKGWFSIIDKYKTESIKADWDESFMEKGEENGFFDEMQTMGEQVCCEYLEKAVEFLDTLPPDPE
ncbi:hypothetical protein EV421DRAFT_2038399 [Armillaria borealis]|uniref:Fungal-type protein kinase domain-containing protein n=1 Tax=Armillaria borealis TaxID=47425 RepID=A0AA39J7Z1_9AGAR|nr:hypothetical protein EV421DRAFT_2038399 [Armillaria borealis]